MPQGSGRAERTGHTILTVAVYLLVVNVESRMGFTSGGAWTAMPQMTRDRMI